jgi:tRNA pseudouridine38-40 synthase
MSRYFLEVAYKGTHYSGFQVQENANTIQAEIEKALQILTRSTSPSISNTGSETDQANRDLLLSDNNGIKLTGSSRTDAGVHALLNYFHFDYEGVFHPRIVYKLNSLLPQDIVVKKLLLMPAEAHSRFDAISRRYTYRIHRHKDPFLKGLSYHFPYKVDGKLIREASALLLQQQNFFAFSKTNTQVKNFMCTIYKSEWEMTGDQMIYTIEGNRFLRGMVRLVTGSILKAGRGKTSLEAFSGLFEGKEKAGFSVPAEGLFLEAVNYPEGYFSGATVFEG